MKKRHRRCDPRKQRYWEEVVRRWKASGQSVRGYCGAEGVREPSFYFWRRKLERCSRPPGAVGKLRVEASAFAHAAPSSEERSSPHRGRPSFLPVRVTRDGPAEATRGVEIVLAHGRTVRVESGFDRQTLADVLAVLEGRPC